MRFVCVNLNIFLIVSFKNFIFLKLREESMNIGMALYDESFMEFSIPVQRKLLFMMMRSQSPLEIKVGNLYPMTLEMFQTLLNSAYSYFNIIRTMYN